MNKERRYQLLRLYFDDLAAHRDREELFAELGDPMLNDEYTVHLERLLDETKMDTRFDSAKYTPLLHAITNTAPVVPVRPRSFIRLAIAAMCILLAGLGVYFLWEKKDNSGTTGVADIPPPAQSKATITLTNGFVIDIDQSAKGTLASEANVEILKLADGSIAYERNTGTDTNGEQYHVLNNPRGSRVVNVVLSDGTRVWLNTESSIQYPAAFTSGTRKVKVTGEAYFEVSKQFTRGTKKNVPFQVEANGTLTEVLGTHFNINAYHDDDATRITLLEGSVKVSATTVAGTATVLKPGEQSSINDKGGFTLLRPDLAQVLSWKNGWFEFDNIDVPGLMKQIRRWYDIEIVYEGKTDKQVFGGRISKELHLSSLVGMLRNNGIHCRIEGKKLIVGK